MILQRPGQKTGRSPVKNKQTNTSKNTIQKPEEKMIEPTKYHHLLANWQGSMSKNSTENSIEKQLIINCDDHPGNVGAIPAGQQQCRVCFILKKQREVCKVCDSRDCICLVRHPSPLPQSSETTPLPLTTIYSFSPSTHLLLQPPAQLTQHCLVFSGLLHRNTHYHWCQSQGMGAFCTLKFILWIVWLALSTWDYMGKPALSRVWVWA